jgi:hypothetical protein
MINFWKIMVDILWRLAIIITPIIGYHIETTSDTNFVAGICGFISAFLIGLYGRFYDEIKINQ